MTNAVRITSLLLCLGLAACDGGTTTDAGAPDTGVSMGDDGGTGPDDSGAGDSGTSEVTCFPLSGPSPDLPDAIPSELTASSLMWMRPTGEICPATGLGDEAVPYDTVCYVNDTGADLEVMFEMVVEDDTLAPAVVVYDGDAIPADRTQCAAVSTDLVIDVADTLYTVPDGARVTFVATLQDPGAGPFQFVITPQ